MELSVHSENGNISHVSVTGEIEARSDIEALLTILGDSYAAEITITFFDINVLHADITEKLHRLQSTVKCKIYALKRYLYLYLSSLGVKCEYVAKKSLQPIPCNEHKDLCRDTPAKEVVIPFLEKIYAQYGYDYTGYQIESIMRRIKISMLRVGLYRFKDFEAAVLQDIEMFEQLFLDFSINTTEFFRNPEVFKMVRDKLLPYLNSYAHIKIWCVGCSSGKEAYSLAILLDELGLLNKSIIYATDINPYIIEEAKNGLFSTDNIDSDIFNYKQAGGCGNFVDYFDLNNTYMRIKKQLQKSILFFQHSLIGSGILNEFQLILCRNVLIYFKPELQEKVLETFYKSLDRSGFLVLGISEGMLLNSGDSYFLKYSDKEKVYKPKQF